MPADVNFDACRHNGAIKERACLDLLDDDILFFLSEGIQVPWVVLVRAVIFVQLRIFSFIAGRLTLYFLALCHGYAVA